MRRRFRRDRGGRADEIVAPGDLDAPDRADGAADDGSVTDDGARFDAALVEALIADPVVGTGIPTDVDPNGPPPAAVEPGPVAVDGAEPSSPDPTPPDPTPPASSPAAPTPPVGADPVLAGTIDGPGSGFWSLRERARADVELLAVPSDVPVLIVGPLGPARSVIRRCCARAGTDGTAVHVLTPEQGLIDDDGWTFVAQPSDLVAAVEDGDPSTPAILVLDVPHDLPAFVGPLVARLRQSGVELVHYVLDDDPDDEDVATWCGELGQPSVLDLAAPIDPARVVQLLDRGEPVVSVAGRALTVDLLTALRADQLSS